MIEDGVDDGRGYLADVGLRWCMMVELTVSAWR